MTRGQLQSLRLRLQGRHTGRTDSKAWRRLKAYKRKPGPPGGSKAWNAVRDALKKGNLVKQPCSVCGDEKVHAHHPLGYDHPLVVEWLCKSCHQRAESGNREALKIIGAAHEGRRHQEEHST